jgi:O-acetyl-ADP-ribose deacetylase (regulator of RNase III)
MKIIKQDVTKLDHGVIAHGCNCQGVMGSGVARALRDRWPEIFEPYYNLCVTGQFSSQLLGKMSIVHINEFPELYVANCLTQHTYGHSGKFANIDE